MTRPRTSLTGRAAILVLVVAALAVTLAIPVRSWLSQRSEIAALESDVSSARERVAVLEGELDDWSDPAYVIAQARSRLHFVFPGEIGYVVLGHDDRPVETQAASATEEVPWYERLWDSTRQADLSLTP
ncbi:MAG: septum formation initiator family protein [Candidatus Nanopelagicales bacterium]|jgi:cell division protein FtsB